MISEWGRHLVQVHSGQTACLRLELSPEGKIGSEERKAEKPEHSKGKEQHPTWLRQLPMWYISAGPLRFVSSAAKELWKIACVEVCSLAWPVWKGKHTCTSLCLTSLAPWVLSLNLSPLVPLRRIGYSYVG